MASISPQALTSEHREMARLLSASYSVKEYAWLLNIPEKTAQWRWRKLAQRFGLPLGHSEASANLALITRWAVLHGLTKLEESVDAIGNGV